jgi:hypothetical protein
LPARSERGFAPSTTTRSASQWASQRRLLGQDDCQARCGLLIRCVRRKNGTAALGAGEATIHETLPPPEGPASCSRTASPLSLTFTIRKRSSCPSPCGLSRSVSKIAQWQSSPFLPPLRRGIPCSPCPLHDLGHQAFASSVCMQYRLNGVTDTAWKQRATVLHPATRRPSDRARQCLSGLPIHQMQVRVATG